jgi:hypothetical protein
MSNGFTAFLMAIVIGAIVAFAWWTPPTTAWIAEMVLLIILFLILGVAVAKRPLGILVTEQNVMSLSRFQTALWSVIIISALLVIALARVRHGVAGESSADPLNITLGKELLALVGISATSLVGSPLIAATKKSKTPDPSAAAATAQELVRTGNVPASLTPTAPAAGPTGAAAPAAAPAPPAAPQPAAVESSINANAQGILYKNPKISDASFTDMFEGDEVGNTAHVDLGKVQMFYFTIIVALAYIVALWNILSKGDLYGSNFTFPALSQGMVALLGISNAGYLANKGVDHTKQ